MRRRSSASAPRPGGGSAAVLARAGAARTGCRSRPAWRSTPPPWRKSSPRGLAEFDLGGMEDGQLPVGVERGLRRALVRRFDARRATSRGASRRARAPASSPTSRHRERARPGARPRAGTAWRWSSCRSRAGPRPGRAGPAVEAATQDVVQPCAARQRCGRYRRPSPCRLPLKTQDNDLDGEKGFRGEGLGYSLPPAEEKVSMCLSPRPW